MRSVEPMEIGLMFWAEKKAETNLQQLAAFDLHSGQLGVPPELDCEAALSDWKTRLDQSQLSITSAVCCYQGEDYSNFETVHKTVGFTTEGLRSDRIARTKEISKFAHALGIGSLSCHIGFIPTDPHEALYEQMRELTKLLCDYCGDHNQNFVLETGQESAEVLLAFIRDVNRPNLKVNFDPANMVIYNSGDPLAALKVLSPHVISVHCKDAHSPAANSTRGLGEECALGDGEVNFPAFLQQLKEMNYQGALTIEREEQDREKRTADIHTGILRLKQWKSTLGL
jgi:L-ribulose-5-phosphate 3-epimerase